MRIWFFIVASQQHLQWVPSFRKEKFLSHCFVFLSRLVARPTLLRTPICSISRPRSLRYKDCSNLACIFDHTCKGEWYLGDKNVSVVKWFILCTMKITRVKGYICKLSLQVCEVERKKWKISKLTNIPLFQYQLMGPWRLNQVVIDTFWTQQDLIMRWFKRRK